ncbi:MAG TPA: glycoside hydrolase family 3 N-terminal domain-containing protein, partial [Ramlibacter sp.]|nr:glycoside hydrolase family 3 N-terminal domain-containing protein [Ramlibacter sp.]
MTDLPAYRDARLDPAERTRDLLARMTLREKVAQLRAIWLKPQPGGRYQVWDRMVEQGTDPGVLLADGIGQVTRPFGTVPVEPADGWQSLRAVQRFLRHQTRLGIPALPHDECLAGFMAQGATQFPSPLNMGSTWDPPLVEEVAAIIGRQMRAAGSLQGLAPVADVVRDARWGRVEECLGEDPYLVGLFVTHYVRGLQQGDLRRGVVATLKHFAGHSAGEGGRNLAPVHCGPRELSDVFLLPFEMAVRLAGCDSVMSAYHDIDGEPASASHWLLTEVLRGRWGFQGTVVADYNIVRYLETKHRIGADRAAVSAAALRAGMDVELPTSESFMHGLETAIGRGELEETVVDQAVARVLLQKFRLGLFEEDFDRGEPPVSLRVPGDAAVARRVAEASLVLLKNDGVLPIAAGARRIAVIGPNAFDQLALFGNYNYPTNVFARYEHQEVPRFAATVHEKVVERFGADRVRAAQGCRILNGRYRKVQHTQQGPTPDPTVRTISDDASGIPEAVALARESDVAVLVLGDRAGHFQTGTVGEGTDVDDISLTPVQRQLAQAVLDTGTPTVVVLVCGRPLALGDIADRAAAILLAWFPGDEGAGAIAAALAGDLNPGGKTPVSFTRSAGAQPFFYNHKALSAGLPLLDHFGAVFPFGHGLSYTRFELDALSVPRTPVGVDDTITVACELRNTGSREGDEVVQLYVRD